MTTVLQIAVDAESQGKMMKGSNIHSNSPSQKVRIVADRESDLKLTFIVIRCF
jgi:hypothetical protein